MPTRRLLTPDRALAAIVFFACVAYCVAVRAACGCSACSAGGVCPYASLAPSATGDTGASSDAGQGFPSAEFRIGDRWRRTATDGFVGAVRGDARTLTWGIVADGTIITGSREGTSPSNFIEWLDRLYRASPGDDDLTARSWFGLIESSFERWEAVSGLTFDYEPADFGAPIDSTTSPVGITGVYADHRIGGHTIDGNGSVLAYNYFPDHADMVVDTFDSFYNNRFGNSRRLRNVLMHEIGHGLGFSHLESSNSSQLMEPFINTNIDGPQIDDILAVQRNYGDPLEKNGGNDTPESATEVAFSLSDDNAEWVIGRDGGSLVVSPTQTDFVSIDGSSDDDYYAFTVDRPSLVDLTLLQLGRTYNEGPQDGVQTTLVTSELNPLRLSLLEEGSDDDPSTRLLADGADLGSQPGQRIEPILLLPGSEYYAHVRGTVDNVQLYQLGISLTAVAIPEPAAALALVSGLFGCAAKRR